jgi:hypothetical protein
LFAKGGENLKRAHISLTKYSFLAIHAKRGESIAQSKRTAPPRQFQNFSKQSLSCSSITIFGISIPLRNSISLASIYQRRGFQKLVSKRFDLISICKTLLNTKRRISLRGSFCLVKEKAFEIGGENFKS